MTFRGCPLSGGGQPPYSKKSGIFQTKYKKYSVCPEKPFLIKKKFCIVTPSLSIGSTKIFIKTGEKKLIFFPFCLRRGLKGRGQSLGNMSHPMKIDFFTPSPKVCYYRPFTILSNSQFSLSYTIHEFFVPLGIINIYRERDG